MSRWKKIREGLSFSGWHIAANTESVIFDLHEPRALLKDCQRTDLKQFFIGLPQNILLSGLVSGCYVGAFTIACAVLGVIFALMKLFTGLDMTDSAGSDSDSGGELGVKGLFIFLGLLVVIFAFFSVIQDLISILMTRYLPLTASFRQPGLLLHGGVTHATWEDMDRVIFTHSDREPDFVYVYVITQDDSSSSLKFFLAADDVPQAKDFLEEKGIPCEHKTLESIKPIAMEVKSADGKSIILPDPVAAVILDPEETDRVDIVPSSSLRMCKAAFSSVKAHGRGRKHVHSDHQVEHSLASLSISIADVRALLVANLPEVPQVVVVEDGEHVLQEDIVAFAVCEQVVLFFECENATVQRAWCKLSPKGNQNESQIELAFDALGKAWGLLLVDWQRRRAIKLGASWKMSRYLKGLPKESKS